MRFITRPVEGYLALIGDDGPETYALPDEKFWEWLKSSGTYAEMVKENPDRMARVEKNGVGVLRCEKQSLLDAGFTRAELVSKRPAAKPVLITEVVERAIVK